MQIDLFAPKESGSVSVNPQGSGYIARYQQQPGNQFPPVIIVDGVLDTYVQMLVRQSPKLAVSWWLIASYAYYQCNETIISDECFDYLTLVIRENYDTIEHVNKDLITEDRLSCGSAFDLRIYPIRVRCCAELIMRQIALARNA